MKIWSAIRLLAVIFASVALSACVLSDESDCSSDSDCASSQRCVSGGGILARGGVCVGPESMQDADLSDTGPADAGVPDADAHDARDINVETDTDTECDEGFEDCLGNCVPVDENIEACGEECVDLDTDPDHCGICDLACDSEQFCDQGSCADDCADELSLCEGQCVDLEANAQHCSDCNAACPASEPICNDGTCVECVDAADCGDEAYYDCEDNQCSCEDERTPDAVCDEWGSECGVAADGCGETHECDYCSGGLPVCDIAAEQCVECIDSDDCTDEVCNGDDNICVECVDDAQCEIGGCVENECPCSPNANAFGGGLGTVEEPYMICEPEHLSAIDSAMLDDNYVLINDLDFDGVSFSPIGSNDEPFVGTFDGQSFEIRNMDITVNTGHIGLFSTLGEEGELRGLHLMEVSAEGGDVAGLLTGHSDGLIEDCSAQGVIDGSSAVGGLVGRLGEHGQITNSTADVTVSGDNDVGGLVGLAEECTEEECEAGIIERTYAAGDITGIDNVGGLIGRVQGCVISGQFIDYTCTSQQITESFATGAVHGDDQIGGLVGQVVGCAAESGLSGSPACSSPLLSDSYAIGDVEGNTEVGGLIGVVEECTESSASSSCEATTIAQTYAYGGARGSSLVGGLIGVNNGDVTDSFWNDDQAPGGGYDNSVGTPLTESNGDFGNEVTFTSSGWDFDIIWQMLGASPGENRPALQWSQP